MNIGEGGDTKIAGTRKVLAVSKWILGLLYVLAGIAKAFPQFEDVKQVLQQAALANQGTLMSDASYWFVSHSSLVTLVVGLALFLSGVCYLTDRFLIPATVGQIMMLTGFITILHRAFWQIFIIDSVFMLVAILVLREQLQKNSAAIPLFDQLSRKT